VKVRLRHREKQAADALRADGAPRVAGLCLKCAQHEAVLAGTHTNLHVQAIDRLTKLVVTRAHTNVFCILKFSNRHWIFFSVHLTGSVMNYWRLCVR